MIYHVALGGPLTESKRTKKVTGQSATQGLTSALCYGEKKSEHSLLNGKSLLAQAPM
jgi:hypothetical protein